DGEDIGIYAHDLFNSWGIGQQGKNNGLLLLCARGEREVFLYTGAGIEHMLTAAAADRILGDYAVPKLANEDYSGGLRDAFLAATNRLAEAYGVTLAGAAAPPPQANNSSGGIFEDIINGIGGIFGVSGSDNYHYEYSYDSDGTSAGNSRGGGGWLGTLVIILIIFFVLGGGRRRRFGGGGGSGCLPFLLGGFLGSSMRRGRGPYRGPSRPPTGGFKPPTGGFKPGGSKPGGGFKPGGGMGRGGGAGRKF
ncbi:MAG: TPM domain-containing protein, partial [Clostridia bacterium]|nr:TPM domain-containing protein [Clostridia bacterium]